MLYWTNISCGFENNLPSDCRSGSVVAQWSVCLPAGPKIIRSNPNSCLTDARGRIFSSCILCVDFLPFLVWFYSVKKLFVPNGVYLKTFWARVWTFKHQGDHGKYSYQQTWKVAYWKHDIGLAFILLTWERELGHPWNIILLFVSSVCTDWH